MTKKEFLKTWTHKTTISLQKMYAGQPHGLACYAASLLDLPRRGEKLWRKYRTLFNTWTVEMLEEKIDKLDAEGKEIA